MQAASSCGSLCKVRLLPDCCFAVKNGYYTCKLLTFETNTSQPAYAPSALACPEFGYLLSPLICCKCTMHLRSSTLSSLPVRCSQLPRQSNDTEIGVSLSLVVGLKPVSEISPYIRCFTNKSIHLELWASVRTLHCSQVSTISHLQYTPCHSCILLYRPFLLSAHHNLKDKIPTLLEHAEAKFCI